MDKKPKFKVGDKVIGNKKANNYGITREGWVGIVTRIREDSIWVSGEGLINGYGVKVDTKCFDLYEPTSNCKAVITSDGKTTTARYYESEKKVSEAKAVCHEEDEFDFNTGAVIALTRAVKGIDNVEVCIKDEVEEPKETEWDKFKKDKTSFVVYQKDIKSFLDACVSDNIKWRVNDKPADDVSEDKWKEWLSFPSIYFRTFPSQIGGGLIWGGFPNCNCSEWLKSFVRWNPSDPNHNPTKTKTYKGITIDGDTAYVKYEGEEIPLDIVKRNGNKLTLVSRNILEFMPFSVSNSNDYAKSDIKSFLHDKFVKRFEPEFINMLTCDGFYLMSEEEVKEYYPERKDRIKKYLDEPYWYWLRTPDSGNSSYARMVNTDGTRDNGIAYNANGVAPACNIILES